MSHARPLPRPGDPSGHSPAPEGDVIKSNAKRTVLAERRAGRDGAAQTVLVKRFHAPGLGRLRDGRRARGEAAALATARERGLPVPGVLGVERENGTWTLRVEWIEDAESLERVLQHAPAHCRRAALTRALGALLARAESAGLRHPDPHAGNLLVSATGQVWLVDLARTRCGPTDPQSFRRMLVRACARLRQSTTPAFRALVQRAYLRARTETTPPAGAAGVEAEARALQRRDVARRVGVWHRTSSATLATRTASGQRVVQVRAAGAAPPPCWTTQRIDASRRAVERIWATLVRATLHGIPTARPRTLALSPPWFVEFDVPDADGTDPTEEYSAALRTLLADRGLALEGAPLHAAEGRVYVGPNTQLVAWEGEHSDG